MDGILKVGPRSPSSHEQSGIKPLRKFQITNELLHSFLYGRKKVECVEVGIDQKNRKRKREETGDEYSTKLQSLWCEKCCKHIQGKCPIHSIAPELTYAVRSFPPEVQLCTSSIPEYKYGACAGKLIPRGTWIGPYEGKRVYPANIEGNTVNTYLWEIYENGKFSHFLDGSDESSSSWMRFIRCARHKNEQNMSAFQYGENIYYRALHDIAVGDEILVWYDHTYAQFWGVPLGLNNKNNVKTKGMAQNQPSVAQHSGLPGAVHGPLASPTNSHSPSMAPRIPPPQRPHPPVQSPPSQQPPSFTQATAAHQPQYQVPRSFAVPQALQSPTSSTVSATYKIAAQPHFPPFSMIPKSAGVPPLMSQGPPLQQPSYLPISPRAYQISQSPHHSPSHSAPGISTAGTSYRPVTDQKQQGLTVNHVITTPSSASYQWSPTEVKENMPVDQPTKKSEIQFRTSNNSQPSKSSPLQSLSPSRNTAIPSPSVSEEKEQEQVSSTVETKGDHQDSCKCGQCGKTFSQRMILQMHVCTQAPKMPFQCGHCSLSFGNPSTLREHVINHSNDRPFKCGFCGRSFAGATTLNNHMRTHTGERPFSCDKCGKTFAIATQLSRHLKQPDECRMNIKDMEWNGQQTTAIRVE